MIPIITTLLNCKDCVLCTTGTFPVGGRGDLHASIMVIGEAPGQQEDLEGKPFVGKSGKELNRLLQLAGISESDVYFTNVVKHWPGVGNPKPKAKEIRACKKWLDAEIASIQPDVILCLGSIAVTAVLGKSVGLRKDHGKGRVVDVGGRDVLVYPMYHPAAAMYNHTLKPILENDFNYLAFNPITKPTHITIIEHEECHCDVSGEFALDLETTSLDTANGEIVCVSYSNNGVHGVVHTERAMWRFLQKLETLPTTARVIMHNAAFDNEYLLAYGVQVPWPQVYDTMISGYVLAKEVLSLKGRVLRELGVQMETFNDVGEGETDASKIEPSLLLPYAAADAVYTFILKQCDDKEITARNCADLLQMEFQVIPILINMHKRGVKIDADKLDGIGQEIAAEILEWRGKLSQLLVSEGIWDSVNTESPTQISELLYTWLQLPPFKKTKSRADWSTDEEALKAIEHLHPIIRVILNIKKLEKLRGTYVEGLRKTADYNWRIHTTYKQTGTETGRLSSTNPNLQNIPQKLPYGPKFRNIFIPERGRRLIVADYSQLELRVVACLAHDEVMLDTFSSEGDIHGLTVKNVLKIQNPGIDDRRLAKNINFGMIYGLGAQGLQRYLAASDPPVHMSLEQCFDIIQNFFGLYKGVKQWIQTTREKGKIDGYSETIMHRRRYFPGVFSGHGPTIEDALKGLVNHPVQGSAADIMKAAMIRIEEGDGGERLLLQIHDEVVLEISQLSDVYLASMRVKHAMEHAAYAIMGLEIFKAEVGFGNSWGSSKPH